MTLLAPALSIWGYPCRICGRATCGMPYRGRRPNRVHLARVCTYQRSIDAGSCPPGTAYALASQFGRVTGWLERHTGEWRELD